MSVCTVNTADGKVTFACGSDTSVLDAALAAGWELPYSCRKGVCDTCRTKIVSGQIMPAPDADGSALLCRVHAITDLEIAPVRIEKISASTRKTVKARVYRIRRPADDVAILDLRFPAGTKVAFKAGQYLQVLFDGEEPRCFSMANAPRANDGVQLHVRIAPGGLFGERILPTLATGDELSLELPFGAFALRDEAPHRPVLMVAGGTGFAPMQSILDDALARHPDRKFILYWGSRDTKGLYALDQVERWKRRHPNFSFVPVISGPTDDVTVRKGLVHEAVLADHVSLAGYDVYVCGAPGLVQAAKSAFVAMQGLPPEQFFADAFATPADVVSAV
jgi:CDP-4-dehydro-6-deoxyglucose reductase